MKKIIFTSLIALSASLMAHEHHDHAKGKTKPNPATIAAMPAKDFLTGQGDFIYKVDLDWGHKPANQEFIGSTHGGVAVDKSGNIYVSTNAQHGIIKYSPDGKIIKTFGKESSSSHNLFINNEKGSQFIYAAFNNAGKVKKIDLEGNIIWSIDGPPDHPAYKGPKAKYKPTAVTVAPDGRLFVADGYATSLIHIYSADQKYIKTFGAKGRKEAQFVTSHGITIDTRGEKPVLIISDRENGRLQRWTTDGEYIDTPTTGLRRPCSISIWGDYIAVAELSARCVILDKDFKVISILGDNPNKKQWHNHGVKPEEWTPTDFTAPHGCSFDAKGNLFVQDWNFKGRLRKFELQTKK